MTAEPDQPELEEIAQYVESRAKIQIDDDWPTQLLDEIGGGHCFVCGRALDDHVLAGEIILCAGD